MQKNFADKKKSVYLFNGLTMAFLNGNNENKTTKRNL